MIITLCGSARFESEYHKWNKLLSLAGHQVFSLIAFPSVEGKREWYTEEVKEQLDTVHLAKIAKSDAVVILNVDGYVGKSTRKEIQFASANNVLIYTLEPISVFPQAGKYQCPHPFDLVHPHSFSAEAWSVCRIKR